MPQQQFHPIVISQIPPDTRLGMSALSSDVGFIYSLFVESNNLSLVRRTNALVKVIAFGQQRLAGFLAQFNQKATDLATSTAHHQAQISASEQNRAVLVLQAMLHDPPQTFFEQFTLLLPSLLTGRHLLQSGDIIGQEDRPGQGDQQIVASRFAGMGFAAAGFCAGENHPTRRDCGRMGAKLIGQILHIGSQEVHDTTASDKTVLGFQKVTRCLLKTTLTRTGVDRSHCGPLFNCKGVSLKRAVCSAKRWRQKGVSFC